MKMLEGIFIPSRRIQVNRDKYFIPASNTKILTSLFAIDSLGEDYLFCSEFILKERTIYIKSRGNPLITEEDIKKIAENCKGEINELVLDIKFLYPDERPPGWCVDDVGKPYAPPVSEINYNFNRVDKNIGGKVVSFSLRNPVNYFIGELRRLISRNLRIRFSRIEEKGECFASRTIGDMLRIMNKNSENSVAEMLLLHSGMVRGARGLVNSLELMKRSLNSHGIRGFRLYDGSGLSYYNLITPSALVRALEILQDKKIFRESLPIGGRDGTLKERLNPRVVAKTGTLKSVQNLSGYIDDDPFSIMLNGVTDQAEAKAYIDSFIGRL
ncbi:MAG: D-alanyl-D-alanine carboxypeptidase/D-alanyl-D-alanine-endopeptidase [Thermoplasmata archaeon]